MRIAAGFISLLVFTTASPASTLECGDTVHGYQNFVSFNPLSLIVGGVGATYERIFGHYGVVAEGVYGFSTAGSSSSYGELSGHYHFRESNLGWFIGPFLKFGDASAKLADDSGDEYRYIFKYSTIGFTAGTCASLWAKRTCCIRFASDSAIRLREI
jgi:hypothetical protein